MSFYFSIKIKAISALTSDGHMSKMRRRRHKSFNIKLKDFWDFVIRDFEIRDFDISGF